MESIAQLRTRLEHQAGGGSVDAEPALSVRTLVRRFLAWGETHYAALDGRNNELASMRYAVRGLLLLYGTLPAAHFGPVQLGAVQGWLCGQGSCRATVLARVRKIRRIFRWAVSRGLLPSAVLPGLSSVEPPSAGQAPRRPRVQAAPLEVVEATLAWLERPRRNITSNPLPSMVRLQVLTGMRPGEVCAMEGRYVLGGVSSTLDRNTDTSAQRRPWTYSPPSHKNSWRGQAREIWLGPKAQAILAPFLTRFGPEHLFRTRRGTPWTTGSYGTAIARASRAAGVECWRPNRLRHLAGTDAAARVGRDTAGAMLGHHDPRSTAVYCHEAREYAARWG